MTFETTLTLGGGLALGLFLTLAYAAENNRTLRYLVYAALGIGDLVGLLAGAAWSLVLFFNVDVTVPPTGPDGPNMGPMIAAIAGVGPIIAAMALVGFLVLFEPFRRLLARMLPIDPRSVVHLVAVHYALLLVMIGALTAASISAANQDPVLLDRLKLSVEQAGLTALWVQMAAFILLSVLGVGLFVSRDWREVLARLGVTRYVSVRYLIAVPTLGLLSGFVVDRWWEMMDPAGMEGVSRLSEALFGSYIEAGLAGVIAIALSAGIGEELLFRGACQPRFGIAVTSVLFAVVHTQYTVSPALVQVFVLAVMLGLARRNANTTTAILCHATYNGILVALAVYAPELGP